MMGHDHSLGGYAGQHRLVDKTLLHFWWPRLRTDLREWVVSCRECQERAKRLPTRNPQTVPVPSPRPWHTLGIDVSGLFPTSHRGNRFVLVVTDHFSKNVETFACPEMTATVVAQILVDEIFSWYGPFEVLLSDRGTNFRSELVFEVLRILKINHKLTLRYHPQCNGLTKCYNQTWEQGVGKQLKAENSLDWDLYLQPFNFSYRTTPHAETHLTSFQLTYGYEPTHLLRVEPVSPLPTMTTTASSDRTDCNWLMQYSRGWKDQDRRERRGILHRRNRDSEWMIGFFSANRRTR
uniref:Integrase catalytic domain-containing protein n=1 Tax=Chromera velia CCMP2878 TaxID=1169474 RepID=A0A0G4G5Y1_9ALVE|eukprot:Cvel_20290.t1-p1 / transcript=Cvel_20290.t1 / gene=Cvel_20290 / organism=Chromera_velia_CCMP2878 / gene_product=Retrovirus-related Pol polyprotein from transposon, putative / transcript_product=Retrovirus-related Pol polyprotein from transposon, putative / location=Cvel_scaffold1811:19551-20426(+) / protein_length=292 / sequence_SO=supercontig / SO=protein_coding / is_pseudo=false